MNKVIFEEALKKGCSIEYNNSPEENPINGGKSFKNIKTFHKGRLVMELKDNLTEVFIIKEYKTVIPVRRMLGTKISQNETCFKSFESAKRHFDKLKEIVVKKGFNIENEKHNLIEYSSFCKGDLCVGFIMLVQRKIFK